MWCDFIQRVVFCGNLICDPFWHALCIKGPIKMVCMLGCLGFCWPVKKCEFPTVMVGVLLLADITKVPKLPIVICVTPHLTNFVQTPHCLQISKSKCEPNMF